MHKTKAKKQNPRSKQNPRNRRNNFKSRKKSNKLSKEPKLDLSKYINEGGKSVEVKAYTPTHTYDELNLDKELLFRLKKKGFQKPTEIQDKSILPLLEGQDLIGVAGTGTGKTAAFLIPIIQNLIKNPIDQFALILAPTRELANQINDEFRSLTKGLKLFSTCLIGGIPVYESIKNLKRTNHIIIGTPGRIMDMHRQKALKFDRFKVLVLDEFDRMLDMGFKDEMKTINSKMAKKQQTMLFSATVDESQKELIAEIAGEAKKVEAATDTQKTDAIKQEVLHVKGQDKFKLMQSLFMDKPKEKVILFCETKRKAELILQKLKDDKVKADAIHGDKSQRAREIALRKFKKGHVKVLVATDVVARGIDVSDVTLVINYEVPRNYTDYVHRIGRTGRAGKTGRAVTMLD